MDDKKKGYTAAGQYPIKLLQAERITRFGRIMPKHIQLVPTNRCNGNCTWCSCKDVDRKLELGITELGRILLSFNELGATAVTITGGGEPTIHPHFTNLLTICLRHSYKIGLVTNGIEFDKQDDLDHVNKALTWLRISVTDTVGAYPVSRIANIATKLPYVDVGISFTVADQVNLETATQVCEIAEQTKNITHVRFVQDILNPVDATMDAVAGACNQYTKAIFQYRNHPTEGVKDCHISLLKPVINADGFVYPCCGVQYASDELRVMPESFRMCHWSDYAKVATFNGKVCKRCYYEGYNKMLSDYMTPVAHGEFI